MKIYEDGKTHLELTEKAYQVYSNNDLLRIVEEEYENENGDKKYRYFIAISVYFKDKPMTEREINAFLERMSDEVGE